MISYAVYDTTTGEILRTGQCTPESLSLKAQGANEAVIEAVANDATDYIADGQVISKGDQPSPDHIFDYAQGQWVFDLSQAKASKWSEIKAARDAQEFGTFDWGGHTFQCDEVSQRRIQGAVQLALLDSTIALEWTLADNTSQVFTADDFVAIGQALAAHVNAGHVKSRALRAQIDAAQTQADIDSIIW